MESRALVRNEVCSVLEEDEQSPWELRFVAIEYKLSDHLQNVTEFLTELPHYYDFPSDVPQLICHGFDIFGLLQSTQSLGSFSVRSVLMFPILEFAADVLLREY
ncbi:hypothetical protein MHU86_13729 [Fragilaria crotonensis]|nr:hypothetical protein MHU86_13729 [Fragilaria crotonensis]